MSVDARDVLDDFASRPVEAAERLARDLSAADLNAHPGGHDNSIAWLLWHAGREIDAQVAPLTGEREVWSSQGFDKRFGLGELGDSVGYGHSPADARAVVVDDAALLLDYLRASTDALRAHIRSLGPDGLGEIIDEDWDPPVTRAARIVSIIDDAAQHVGQAAYAAGILRG
ncbi:mycothiol transferase [Pseudoclavibacter helvolus]|uniref:mycothiol transferase n=1 Tax=Pseudoclavibacter helvolus TaxID=255205 RepID=UPI003C74FB24